jgi:DNA-binding GntR family transcriptional regulator
MQLALTHGESRATDEHRTILAAARKGEVDRTSALLREHIISAGFGLAEFLRVHRESAKRKVEAG